MKYTFIEIINGTEHDRSNSAKTIPASSPVPTSLLKELVTAKSTTSALCVCAEGPALDLSKPAFCQKEADRDLVNPFGTTNRNCFLPDLIVFGPP